MKMYRLGGGVILEREIIKETPYTVIYVDTFGITQRENKRGSMHEWFKLRSTASEHLKAGLKRNIETTERKLENLKVLLMREEAVDNAAFDGRPDEAGR